MPLDIMYSIMLIPQVKCSSAIIQSAITLHQNEVNLAATCEPTYK